MNMLRARTCGSLTVSSMLLTAAAGTPVSASAFTTSTFGRWLVHAAMIAATASRRSRRTGTVAKSGSVVSSGRPMTLQKRLQMASLVPAAIAT